VASFLWIAASRAFWASRMSSSRILRARQRRWKVLESGDTGNNECLCATLTLDFGALEKLQNFSVDQKKTSIVYSEQRRVN
jgi:hypothetical protein